MFRQLAMRLMTWVCCVNCFLGGVSLALGLLLQLLCHSGISLQHFLPVMLAFELDFMFKSSLLIVTSVLIRLLPNHGRLLRVRHVLTICMSHAMKLIDRYLHILGRVLPQPPRLPVTGLLFVHDSGELSIELRHVATLVAVLTSVWILAVPIL